MAETLGNASAKREAEVEGTWLSLVELFQGYCDCQGEQVAPYSGYLAQRPSGAKMLAVFSLQGGHWIYLFSFFTSWEASWASGTSLPTLLKRVERPAGTLPTVPAWTLAQEAGNPGRILTLVQAREKATRRASLCSPRPITCLVNMSNITFVVRTSFLGFEGPTLPVKPHPLPHPALDLSRGRDTLAAGAFFPGGHVVLTI